MSLRVLVRGGGDLATGAALRCFRAGWQVLITEIPQPLAVRRSVSFSQAVYDGGIQVEETLAACVVDWPDAQHALVNGHIPVLVDPPAAIHKEFEPDVLVDGRMMKADTPQHFAFPTFTIGLGPGFTTGVSCHAVVETLRGPTLGRVYWSGQAAADTGLPERIGGYQRERLISAPVEGVVTGKVKIGEHVEAGQALAQVNDTPAVTPIAGVVRGLIHDGVSVPRGCKIGDVDPRDDPSLCYLVSDKALAVGGGVLEAILTWLARKP